MRAVGIALIAGVLAIITARADSVTWGGHTYTFVPDQAIDWPSARSDAEGLSGYLATVMSADENAAVASLLAQVGAYEAWLGGYQVPETEPIARAGWTWVDGNPIPGDNTGPGYANWNGGEPNDNYGTASEQFMAMWGTVNNGTWNDEGALGNITGYVVEFDTAPEVASTAGLLSLAFLGLAMFRRKSS
jgi:hypothetical protein